MTQVGSEEEGQDFEVDTKAEIKWDYREALGSTSMSLVLCDSFKLG